MSVRRFRLPLGDGLAVAARKARRKVRFWRALYAELSPSVRSFSVVRVLAARELANHGRLGPTRSIAVRLRPPLVPLLRLRPGGSDLATFNEVMREEVYRPVCEAVASCARIVDLGAHIGLSSIYFLTRYPEARLLAIEPHAGSAALLIENLDPWIRSGRCEVVLAAAWSEDGPLEPIEGADDWYQSSFRVRSRSALAASSITGLSVPSILKLAGPERIDLLKVDVEGAEREIFSGECSWLDTVDCLAIEFHEESRTEICFDDLAESHGFSVVADGGHTVVASRRMND